MFARVLKRHAVRASSALLGHALCCVRAFWERHSAGAARGHAHAFIEQVLNTVAMPVFVKDRSHRFVFVNDALCALLGHSRSELLGKSDYDFFPRAQADIFVAKDELVFATRAENTNEEDVTDATGVRRRIVTRKAVFRDVEGNDVLVGVINDITDHKRLEELVRLNAQVFEHSTEGMFITDEHNTILNVNRAFTEITGYAANEVVGKNPRILSSGTLPAEFYREMWRALTENGYWQGEIPNRRKNGELYSEWLTISTVKDDQGKARQHIALFSDITKRKRTEERIRFLAHHDALTGLANRALLGDRVQQAVSRSRRASVTTALLLLDLDHFKEINDNFGHQAGDQLLRGVARRLLACTRESDTVSRLGGDEFVVLLAETTGADDAEIVARRVIEALGRPFLLHGTHAQIGVSIGIAVAPGDGTDADALLRSADEAMYRVKRTGRNGFSCAASAVDRCGDGPAAASLAGAPSLPVRPSTSETPRG